MMTAKFRPGRLEITSLAVESLRPGVQRNVVRRLFIVRAKLRHFERFEVICGDEIFARLDRFAKSVSDLVSHLGMDHHRPAAEVYSLDVLGQPLKSRPGHYRRAIPYRHQALQNLSIHGQVTKPL